MSWWRVPCQKSLLRLKSLFAIEFSLAEEVEPRHHPTMIGFNGEKRREEKRREEKRREEKRREEKRREEKRREEKRRRKANEHKSRSSYP